MKQKKCFVYKMSNFLEFFYKREKNNNQLYENINSKNYLNSERLNNNDDEHLKHIGLDNPICP